MGTADNSPDDVCGFVIEPEDMDREKSADDDWHETTRNACCIREPKYDGQCIWHADTEKDAAELVEARLESADLEAQRLKPATGTWGTNHVSEHLSGAVLRDVEFPEGFSFGMCVLVGADFQDTDLPQAKFPKSHLRRAEFSETNLREAQFSETHLYKAQFLKDTELEEAQFPEAHIREAQFTDVFLRGAKFSEAKMREAQFLRAHMKWTRFPEADLRGAQFREANLQGARFPEANLRRAQFPEANIKRAQFSETKLSLAQFPEANLLETEFQNADLRKVKFPSSCVNPKHSEENPPTDPLGATLEDAQFEERTDLRGADLSGARLYQAAFTDVRINDETKFGWDNGGPYGVKCRYDYDQNTSVSVNEDVPRLQAAAWTYGQLESLFEENVMVERGRNAHIRKKEAQREHQRKQARNTSGRERITTVSQYAVSTLNWHLTRHGESIKQILIAAKCVIFACGILYPFVGGFASDSTETRYRFWELVFESVASVPVPHIRLLTTGPLDFLGTLLQSMYFSVITFTTIGYGDLYPTGVVQKY